MMHLAHVGAITDTVSDKPKQHSLGDFNACILYQVCIHVLLRICTFRILVFPAKINYVFFTFQWATVHADDN